jgi:hypothetical protein
MRGITFKVMYETAMQKRQKLIQILTDPTGEKRTPPDCSDVNN